MPSILEAIEKKYGSEDEEFDLPIAIYVPKKNARTCLPSLLVLNNCNIDSAGTDEELKKKCQPVEDLDVAQNKLTKWSEVFAILRHMPRIRFVNVSFNNLSEPFPFDFGETFPHLQSLVLNATKIHWESVEQLLRLLPSLEELHLSLNNFETVQLGSYQHKGVCRLHFAGNPMHSWTEASKLGEAFPSLQSLVLADCPVTSLEPPATQIFHCLQFLNINGTQIASWNDVDSLRCYPCLQELRIQSIPLFEDYTEHERRQHLIARLPTVLVLNGGGQISSEERETSERAFIRFFMSKPEGDRPQRYQELVNTHGQLSPLANVNLRPQKEVVLTLVFGDEVTEKKVSVYLTVSELKKQLEPTVGVPPQKMKLYYVDKQFGITLAPEEMRYPQKLLYSYNMATGDEIIIDIKC